jgi:hypothetical protein
VRLPRGDEGAGEHITLLKLYCRQGMKRMAASSFKTKCLAVMDEVRSKRETVMITKKR